MKPLEVCFNVRFHESNGVAKPIPIYSGGNLVLIENSNFFG